MILSVQYKSGTTIETPNVRMTSTYPHLNSMLIIYFNDYSKPSEYVKLEDVECITTRME